MKLGTIRIITCIILVLTISIAYSQNAKKLFKSGSQFSKIGSFDKAIELYSEAISLNPKFTKAIEARAHAYEELSKYEKAAADYETLTELEAKDNKLYFKAGSLYCKAGKFKEAIPLLTTSSELDPKNAECFYLKSQAYQALNNTKDALIEISNAIDLNPLAEYYYQRGIVYSDISDYKNAELDYQKSISLKSDQVAVYNQLAFSQLQLNKLEAALETLTKTIELDNRNKSAYLLKSHIYIQQGNYNKAIDNLSKLLTYFPYDTKILFQRGTAYFDNKKYQESIYDLNKVIEKESDNKLALEKRAKSYEALNYKESALKDYHALLLLLKNDTNNVNLISEINNKVFDLQREKNAPELSVIQKSGSVKNIEIPDGLYETSIKVKVTDQNDISSIKVDDKEIEFDQDLIKSGQDLVIEVADKKSLKFEITDIYNNITTKSFTLIRKDTGLPRVAITTPLSVKGNTLFLTSLEPGIEIKGRIFGKNKIKSLIVNNLPASFSEESLNPAFSLDLNIENVSEITFDIIDDEGNHVVNKYKIDRSDAEILSDNPMGRTWVVFIENSDYKEFTSLEGPKKEIDLMVKALNKYKIDKVIHKRNLTRSQMEYFFSYELKNEVINNRVNSIMLWYAGHGKFVGQTGYWIPIDSKVDDLSSYYNLNSLKIALKPYTDIVTHSLIVTDACESGPGFYMSLRSIPTDKDCSNVKSTKKRSSQIFTSSGNDVGDGDSEFTKEFANSLLYNSKACIPIERIANDVSLELSKKTNIRPKFGKISGFSDENGTFIFIKK